MKAVPAILVVDDEQNNIKAITRLLRLNDYDLLSCASGAECIEFVRNDSKHIDLILMDIMMPDMDGHETCAILRNIAPQMPVIMMTALLDDAVMRKSFDVGAVDFIRKPINEMELLSRIGNMLRIKNAERKVVEYNTMIKDELFVAAGVQSFLLPDWILARNNMLFSSIYEASQDVSGDLYDVIPLDDFRSIVYTGDISGHGVQSALLMTAVGAVIKMIVKSDSKSISPCSILNSLNSTFSAGLFSTKYMTMLLGVYDSRDSSYCYFNAGHPPIIEYNQARTTARIIEDSGSVPVGWLPDVSYNAGDENTITLSDECQYLFYTDGLFEAFDSENNMIGIDGVLRLIENLDLWDGCIALPYIIKNGLIEQGYELRADDFSVMSLTYIAKQNMTYFFYSLLPQLSHVAGIGSQCECEVNRIFANESLGAKVELVINEYLNNVILHGENMNGHQKPKIHVLLEIDSTIRLTIWDRGESWVLPDSEGQVVSELSESGRGIMIIKEIAQRLSLNHWAGLNQAVITIIP